MVVRRAVLDDGSVYVHLPPIFRRQFESRMSNGRSHILNPVDVISKLLVQDRDSNF